MAQGSHATWEGVPPEARVCRECGKKLRMTKDSFMVSMQPEPSCVCSDCMPHYAIVRRPK